MDLAALVRLGTAVLASVLLAACGSSERVAPRETIHDHAPVEPSVTTEPIDAAVEPAPTPEPPPEADAGAPIATQPDLGPIDHRATPCFTDRPRTSHTGAPFRHPSGPFEAVVHRSIAPDALGQIHVRPGTTVRFDVTMENVGTEDVVLDAADVLSLQQLSVMGLSAAWVVAIDGVTPLAAGQHVPPHAMLRLCAELEVPRTPIDSAPPGERQRVYALDWAEFYISSGVYFQVGREEVVVTYPASHGPRRREADSWGGVIRVVLQPGASILRVARETGVLLGSGAPLFSRRLAPDASASSLGQEELVQAPIERRVADAVAALVAHPAVISATALRLGDAGTEGCGPNNPCGPGEQCCYMCGIPGCPNSCYRGPSCPMGIP